VAGSSADNLFTLQDKESPRMSHTSQQSVDRRPANLAALHNHLKEMATHVKRAVPGDQARLKRIEGPTIVIRGK
jgi:hypothetical protein